MSACRFSPMIAPSRVRESSRITHATTKASAAIDAMISASHQVL